MAQAQITKTIPVALPTLFQAITDYASYPQFVDGCVSTKVHRPKDGAPCTVDYKLNMMKEVEYTLEHHESLEKGLIEWTLVKSDFFKKNTGKWTLVSKGPHSTEATYSLDVEFAIPVPGFILNRLIKGSLPSLMKGFEERALKLAKKA